MRDLVELQSLVAVAHAGSFAGAARRLGVSPAMVGRRILALEARYGARFIERTTRSLRFTALGEEFVSRSARILEEIDELEEAARPRPGIVTGRLRVSAPVTLGVGKVVDIVSNLAKQHPDLSIDFSLSDRNVDLVREGFDLAIRIGELTPSGLIARKIGTYRLLCCAAPALLERYGALTDPVQLKNFPCIINANLQPRDRWPFRSGDGRVVLAPVSGPIELDNDQAQLSAARAGVGVIYVPRHLAAGDIAGGRLIEVLGSWHKPELPIYAVQPSRRLSPRRVTIFIEALVEGFRDDQDLSATS